MDQISAHPILTILVTLLASSTGTLVLSRLMMSRKDAADVATQLYTAMSGQLTAMQGHVSALQTTVDEWKGKYYEVLERCGTLELDNQHLVGQVAELMLECTALKEENQRHRAEIDLLNPKPALYKGPHAKPEAICS